VAVMNVVRMSRVRGHVEPLKEHKPKKSTNEAASRPEAAHYAIDAIKAKQQCPLRFFPKG
jgi:hypothetical protein